MKETKYTVKTTTQFKKDYKLAIKRGLKIDLLKAVVAALAMGETLPEKNRDHALTGNWVGHRECHILPDWLLIYRIEDDVLVLTLARIGSHSDLFGKQSRNAKQPQVFSPAAAPNLFHFFCLWLCFFRFFHLKPILKGLPGNTDHVANVDDFERP